MPIITPLPIEIALAAIPHEQSPKSRPQTVVPKPISYPHAPIPVHIVFPITRPRTVELPVRIRVTETQYVDVLLALTAVEQDVATT